MERQLRIDIARTRRGLKDWRFWICVAAATICEANPGIFKSTEPVNKVKTEQLAPHNTNHMHSFEHNVQLMLGDSTTKNAVTPWISSAKTSFGLE